MKLSSVRKGSHRLADGTALHPLLRRLHGLVSEGQAAANIAADLDKMRQFGLFTEATLADLYASPLIAVDPRQQMVSVEIQLERANTLDGIFEPVGVPYLFTEAAADKAFYRLVSRPGL